MKKSLMIAFAFCMASLAQAVVVTWDSAGYKTLEDVDFSQDITVTYTYTLNSAISTRTNFLWLGLGQSTTSTNESNAIEYRMAPVFSSSAVSVISFASSYNYNASQVGISSLAAGTYTLTMTINVAEQTCSYTLSNGTDSATTTMTLSNNSVPSTDVLTVYMRDPTNNSGTAVGTFVSGSIDYSLPEPTVLALLALGVAGLALRRRA